ncbi:hypothetical protein STEG23_007349 [Scotinomys teguina]
MARDAGSVSEMAIGEDGKLGREAVALPMERHSDFAKRICKDLPALEAIEASVHTLCFIVYLNPSQESVFMVSSVSVCLYIVSNFGGRKINSSRSVWAILNRAKLKQAKSLERCLKDNDKETCSQLPSGLQTSLSRVTSHTQWFGCERNFSHSLLEADLTEVESAGKLLSAPSRDS